MNNSFFAVENSLTPQESPISTEILRERESKLVKILSAIRGVAKTEEWGTLKEEVFDSLTETLSNEIGREARKESPDTLKLNRLAGQLKWAEKYSDLSKLENVFKAELQGLKSKLYGKT